MWLPRRSKSICGSLVVGLPPLSDSRFSFMSRPLAAYFCLTLTGATCILRSLASRPFTSLASRPFTVLFLPFDSNRDLSNCSGSFAPNCLENRYPITGQLLCIAHSRGESFFFLGEKYNPQRRKPDNLKTFSRSRVGIRAAQISPLAAGVGDPRIRI